MNSIRQACAEIFYLPKVSELSRWQINARLAAMAVGALIFGPREVWFFIAVGTFLGALLFLPTPAARLIRFIEFLALTLSHLLVLSLLLLLYFVCLAPMSLVMLFRTKEAVGRRQSEAVSPKYFERPY